MAIKSFKRYEKKFILTQEQYDAIIPRLLEYMDPDKHCRDGKNYSIYNIYYDTKNNDVIRHSISKPSYKEKLRLRSYYIPESLDDTVFLELKKKVRGIVLKRRAVLTLRDANNFLKFRKRPENCDYINSQVLDEIEYYLEKNEVIANVYISYSRKAFFCKADNDFRLTFDSEIISRRDNLALEYGSFGTNVLEENKYLMEVKILGAMPIWFVQILSELGIYNTNFSKYGNEFDDYCLQKRENSYQEVNKTNNINNLINIEEIKRRKIVC